MAKNKKEKITRGILIGLLCLLCAGFIVGTAFVISAYTGGCDGKENKGKDNDKPTQSQDAGDTWTPNY